MAIFSAALADRVLPELSCQPFYPAALANSTAARSPRPDAAAAMLAAAAWGLDGVKTNHLLDGEKSEHFTKRCPESVGSVWQLLRYSHSPLPLLEACARRYGDPFTIRLAGYGKFVMLSSPEAVQDVFRGDSRALHSGEGNEFLSAMVTASPLN